MSLTSALQRIAHKVRPLVPASVYRSVQMYVGRRNAREWLQREGVLELGVKVAQHFDYRVQTGPFAGLRYTRSAVLSRHATPTLLGTYERQIYPFLEAAIERCSYVIDIGCAEGYFALGIAQMGKQVVAFDANPHERRVFREMAAANRLARLVKVERWCSPARLIELVRAHPGALIICDIDGGELDLFTPEVISAIRHCDLIVELHGKDAEENLPFVKRFDDSARILNHPAEPAEVSRLSFLPAGEAARMATEYRPPQQWLLRRGNFKDDLRDSDLKSLKRALIPDASESIAIEVGGLSDRPSRVDLSKDRQRRR
jgi:hypothetical protein